jgi:hypothetical protein
MSLLTEEKKEVGSFMKQPRQRSPVTGRIAIV